MLQVTVGQDSPQAYAEGNFQPLKGTKRGEVCVVDFLTECVLEGRGFQVRAGTKSTAITGDIVLTDTASEMCVEAESGVTFLPLEVDIGLNNLAGDGLEMGGKSVGTLSSAGTLFTPLPLYSGGTVSLCRARTKTAGGVTVAAEATTTTCQHFVYVEEFVGDTANEQVHCGVLWIPRLVPVLNGTSCFYVQIASATAGPGYFAHINYVEMPTANIT